MPTHFPAPTNFIPFAVNKSTLIIQSSTAGDCDISANPQIVIGEGNVVLQRAEPGGDKGLVLNADWIKYNVDEGIVHARGNLSMHSARADVSAEEAVLLKESRRSVLYYFGDM